MVDFTPFAALMGGGLIGLASAIYLLAHGRICGISGILGGLLCRETDERAVRLTFFGGLLAGGAILAVVAPSVFASAFTPTLSLAVVAGLLVGFGTQLGSGCTSGHGVCGTSRLSARSLVATGTFMLTGFITVYIVQHVIGGGL